MKKEGVIVQYDSKAYGCGIIACDEFPKVRFERCECNYEQVRVNDVVLFDLVKSSDGLYDALDIEFYKNPILSELERCYHKQAQSVCEVLYKTEFGYTLEYKGIHIYLPVNHLFNHSITIGESYDFYINVFSRDANIIASKHKKLSGEIQERFEKYQNMDESLVFTLEEKNDYGMILGRDNFLGFLPNSHIYPLVKDDLKIKEEVFVRVISCSISNSLILSARNHYLSDVLQEISEAYKNGTVLSGEVVGVYSTYFLIMYKGIQMKMNIHHTISSPIETGSIIRFKVIKFSANKDISISNVESSEYGILDQVRGTNMFLAKVERVLDHGVIVILNDCYQAFMCAEHLSESIDAEDALAVLQRKLSSGKTTYLKCSVLQFGRKGISVSRVKSKRKERVKNAFGKYKIGDRVFLKISQKLSFVEIPLENENSKGYIHLKRIIPESLVKTVGIGSLVKMLQKCFPRHAIIKCIIVGLNPEEERFMYDFDLADDSTRERISMMIDFFAYDKSLHDLIQKFYEEKEQQQLV